MFRSRLSIAVCCLGFSGGLGACALPPSTVRFAATSTDWQMLAGEWRGEYWMHAFDRHGTIAFTLVASTEQASGDVLMISDRFGWPYQSYPLRAGVTPLPAEPRTQLLTIRFVRADRGRISGRLDSYWDPDRRCPAAASFLGSVDGNIIRGTLSSVCEDDGRRLDGRWKVERKCVTGEH